MKGSVGNIRFATGLQANKQTIIYLQIIAAPNAEPVKVLFAGSLNVPQEFNFLPNKTEIIRLKATTDSLGDITITLKVKTNYDAQAHHPRVFCIGLASVAFVDAEDVIGRTELLENMLIDHN